MLENDIYAPPEGSFLNSVVNDRLDVKDVFGEFIDNAIDADAKSIVIEVGEKRQDRVQSIRIEDDGDGCLNLVDMVQFGKHTDHKTTVLGRYGIGAKYGMLWLGGLDSDISITSLFKKDGRVRRMNLNWRAYGKGWRIRRDCMDERSADQDDKKGTTVLIRPCIRRFPEGKAFDNLLREFGYVYSPAIKRGVQIQFRVKRRGSEPVVLQRWELPPISEIVDRRINVGGRGARIYVGLVQEGATNERAGVTYMHGFRVVKRHGGLGCGGMDYSGICGFVELDGTWELTKNKDDISQNQEELSAAVFAELKPLLDRAAARCQEMAFSELTGEVEKHLNAMIGAPDGKAVRGKGDKDGAKQPKNTGRKHKRANEEQDGETFIRRRFGRLRVSYQNLGDPDHPGQHDDGLVILNTANAWVSESRHEANAKCLALLAALVFMSSIHAAEKNGQQRLRWDPSGDIVRDIGRLLSRPATIDGKPLLSIVEKPVAAE